MRNGNRDDEDNVFVVNFVVCSLPMRNGNSSKAADKAPSPSVCSLPMRNGNVECKS